jgi:hypothetical protein
MMPISEKDTIYEWDGAFIEIAYDENTQYVMTASAGTLPNQKGWKITKIEICPADSYFAVEYRKKSYPDGNKEFVWTATDYLNYETTHPYV